MRAGVGARRRGSIVVVFAVLVVLGALGSGAMLLSQSMSKKDQVFAIRENAFEAARAAAEEAALLVNNGAINVAIDKSLAENAEQIEVASVMVNDATLEYLGIPEGNKPKVKVRAAVVSPDALPKKPPLEELKAIKKEIESRGFVGQTAADLQEFWARVDGTNTIFGSGSAEDDNEGIKDNNTNTGFWNQTAEGDIGRWGPPNRMEVVKDANDQPVLDTNGNPVQEIRSNDKIGALGAVYALFYSLDAQELNGTQNKKPSVGELLPAWQAAMQAVGQDAATRMESCGSNPALAMSHLVGDVSSGQAIASGTEVAITSAFVQLDNRYMANKTYLLEIEAEMPYGETPDSGKVAKYTTYRVFSKSQWEGAVENMTVALTGSLKRHGMSCGELAQMFPADPSIAGRDAEIPGCTEHFDPKKVVSDEVFKKLPSMVGARMYPYTIANAYPQREY